MLEKVYLAKQKIFNRSNKVFANELLFRDHEHGINNFPTHMKATSHVLVNVLTNINSLINESGILLINVDEEFLLSNMVELLDKNRFMLEILETTELSEDVVSKIIQYHKGGFKIAIDDFDCSAEMIKKFTPLFKYVHLIKIDVIDAEPQNLENVVGKFKKMGLKLLAEKIETEEDHQKYLSMGFDLFQGYHLDRPETIEIDRKKDVTQYVILHLLKLIKSDAGTDSIESYIKQRPELSFKLIKFLNTQVKFETKIESIVQVITLLGRDRLLRWLLLYLYSEMADNPVCEAILAIATKRAEFMENEASPTDRDKAYTAGMFTMLGALFDVDNKEIIKGINLDKDITELVVNKKGKFLSSLLKSEKLEQVYLKQLMIANFEKIDPIDILYVLGINGVEIDKNKF